MMEGSDLYFRLVSYMAGRTWGIVQFFPESLLLYKGFYSKNQKIFPILVVWSPCRCLSYIDFHLHLRLLDFYFFGCSYIWALLKHVKRENLVSIEEVVLSFACSIRYFTHQLGKKLMKIKWKENYFGNLKICFWPGQKIVIIWFI